MGSCSMRARSMAFTTSVVPAPHAGCSWPIGSRVEQHFPGALITEAALTSNLTLVAADRPLAKLGQPFIRCPRRGNTLMVYKVQRKRFKLTKDENTDVDG